MTGVIIILTINLLLSFFIFSIAFKVYRMYRRTYLIWFLIALSIVPVIFIYSFIEFSLNLPIYASLFYPIGIIIIEILVIIAQKSLISSVRTEEGEEYKILLREDVALIRAFKKLSNYIIGKISSLIGIENVKRVLEGSIEKYPIIAGCYIGIDERLKTKPMEEDIDEIQEEKLSEAFSYFITKLIELYATFVPYEKIAEELRIEIGKIDRRIIKWFIPFSFFKLVMEPILRECRTEELREIRIVTDIEGVSITKKGGIEFHPIFGYREKQREEKFLSFLERTRHILERFFGESVYDKITENFRKLPNNVKEEMYRYDFIKKLPKGILEEEKITLMSRERLIEELAERKKKLEEAYRRLTEAKFDKMKSTFIDIIAHELKTPLTAIKTYTDLLRKEKLGKLNKIQREKLEKMAKNIERLTKLIDDMLQIPSVDIKELELRKEKFYVKEAIQSIITETEEMAREKKQKININIEDSLTIEGDRKLIEKALKNIILNAIKYTHEKGIISIEAKKDGSFAHLIIKDNGKGIPPSELEKIFEPFYTRDGGGVGLGLAIAKNVVESHGGKIWAESKGKGSTFHVLLKGGII
ncbi:hypothetical protein B6U81_01635 [Thermoplasmatales archaeon ex4484_30]|nr:MAG: HAMP domain-containing histidine kinase [Thermoplasmata archaeon]OYT62060.1 MAG: hypothetical protein B6U81_01635 [Thermoplasmatales archaeon ex4484_30]